MQAYSCRTMTIEDYDDVYALWTGMPGIGLSEADGREPIEAYLARNPGQSFVCETDESIVGAILCGNDMRRAYIHHLAVAPEHRRCGLASELVRLATGVQRGLGIQKCHLFVVTGNDGGVAFWRAMGYEKRTDIEIMSKML